MALDEKQRYLEYLKNELREGRISRQDFARMRLEGGVSPGQYGATKRPSAKAQVLGKQVDAQRAAREQAARAEPELVFTEDTLEAQRLQERGYSVAPEQKVQTITRNEQIVGLEDPVARQSIQVKPGSVSEKSLRQLEAERIIQEQKQVETKRQQQYLKEQAQKTTAIKKPSGEIRAENKGDILNRMNRFTGRLEYEAQLSKNPFETQVKSLAAFGISALKPGVQIVTRPVEAVKGTIYSYLHPIATLKNVGQGLKETPAQTLGELFGGYLLAKKGSEVIGNYRSEQALKLGGTTGELLESPYTKPGYKIKLLEAYKKGIKETSQPVEYIKKVPKESIFNPFKKIKSVSFAEVFDKKTGQIKRLFSTAKGNEITTEAVLEFPEKIKPPAVNEKLPSPQSSGFATGNVNDFSKGDFGSNRFQGYNLGGATKQRYKLIYPEFEYKYKPLMVKVGGVSEIPLDVAVSYGIVGTSIKQDKVVLNKAQVSRQLVKNTAQIKQDTALNVKPVAKLSINPRSRIVFKDVQAIKTKPALLPRFETTLKPKNETIPKQEALPKSEIISILKPVQIQASGQVQAQKQAQIQKQVLKYSTFPLETYQLQKKLPKPIVNDWFANKKTFSIFARRQGKDVQIGQARTLKGAENILKGFLGGTSAASGKILNVRTNQFQPFNLGFGYRKSKIDPFRIVEKNIFRINTPGELQQITYKGLLQPKKKRGKKR